MAALVLSLLAIFHALVVAVFFPVHWLVPRPAPGELTQALPTDTHAAYGVRLCAAVLVAVFALLLAWRSRQRWPGSEQLATWSALALFNTWLFLLYAGLGAYLLLAPVPPPPPAELAEPLPGLLVVLMPIVWIMQLLGHALHGMLVVAHFALRIVTVLALLTGTASYWLWRQLQRGLRARASHSN